MTPERWQQIRTVYEHAVSLGVSERAVYLDTTCKSDGELRQEVESLLSYEERAGSAFLKTPAVDLVQAPPEEEPLSRIGRRVGVYEIVEELGRGGMGEVYRATRTDGQYTKPVAVKFVRGGFDSRFILERFRTERLILATLDHPNIARWLDGGTTDDGIPYLVMELIEGERIDDYCQNHTLTVSERLQLFRQICGAVQYAHQRLVIHRDIKPSNILVTEEGVPKLLDFGIAKILDPAAGAETTLARPMTPEYASPEQIRGETITTASDVYSLGVVLYKLLTGRSPYHAGSDTPHELSRAIVDTEVLRPSAAVLKPEEDPVKESSRTPNRTVLGDNTAAKLSRQLRGDLDDIALLALRKEPERRYDSVQQFSEDISRHLNGLPVTASRGSWRYRTGKFVRRHRAGVLVGSLALVTLVVGVGLILREVRVARAERQRADKRFDDVRKLSNSMVFDVNDAMADVPGNTRARKILLDRAVEYLDKLAQDSNGNTDLQRELAWGYQRLAAVQGSTATEANVGEVDAADISTHKAIALFEAVAKANPDNASDQMNLAVAHRTMGDSDTYYPDGRPEIERALFITERLLQKDPADPKILAERAKELLCLGFSQNLAGERTPAADTYRQAVTLLGKVQDIDPSETSISTEIAHATVVFGWQLAIVQDLGEARRQVDKGVSGYEALAKNDGRPNLTRYLAASRWRQAWVAMMSGDFSTAKTSLDQSYESVARLAKLDPENVVLRLDLAGNEFEQGRLLVMMGRFAEGRAREQEGITNYEKIQSDEGLLDVSSMYAWLGKAQLGEQKYADALRSYEKAVSIGSRGAEWDDKRCGRATSYVGVGDAQVKLGRYQEAAEAYRKATAEIDLPSAIARKDIPALYPMADAYSGMGDLAMALANKSRDSSERTQNRKEACTDYQKSLDIWKRLPQPSSLSPSFYPAGNSHEVEKRFGECGAEIRS